MRLVRRLAEETYPPAEPPPSEPSAETPGDTSPAPLTSSELEVLRHLAEGETNRRIAEEMRLSLSTVKRHLERIISKLEVSDRTQAAVKAVERGLIDPDRAE